MSNLNRDMVFMILQFLQEEKLEATLHQLESESGFFFNIQYFEQKFLAGDWDEVENYLSGFTKLEDNRSSMQLYFEIRKQKYFEALDNPDRKKAMHILRNELEVFSSVNEEVHKQLSSLLILENIRQHEYLSNYQDAESARRDVLVKLKTLFETNPILQNKLQFPSLQRSHLRKRLNQTSNPRARRTNAPLVIREGGSANLIEPKTEVIEEQKPDITSLEKEPWSLDDLPRVIVCTLNRDSDVTSLDFHPSRQTILAAGHKNGEVTLWELIQREILISKPFKIKDISTCSRFFQDTIRRHHSFIPVTRVSWCPDGAFIGVAFKKHLIHLYTYDQGSNDLKMYLEIEAHLGAVNDLAFCYPVRDLAFVTCGDDKLIKVWDMAGDMLFRFVGHSVPVHSVCPHQRENDRFLVSSDVDGLIKVWHYGEDESRVVFSAPGQWFGRMLYNAEGNRLFSGGTSKDGLSCLVEWDESERLIKRTYSKFRLRTRGRLQFDISKNRFLAAGEDKQIKFWTMDDATFLAATFANGGLPSLPLVRFNKEGNLLAVTTADGGFKVLANSDGLKSVSSSTGTCSHGPSNYAVAVTQASSSSGIPNVLPNVMMEEGSSSARPAPNFVNRTISDEQRSELWPLEEYVEPSQCVTATLRDSFDSSTKVVCLVYNNAGTGILALGSNGLLKLWKWVRNHQNPEGKPTAGIVPVLWRPRSGLLMNNDVAHNTEALPFIALTKNDDFLMSASGGKVSLFSTKSFKAVETFRPHPSAVTHLAFHILDNNVMAMGMEDSTISIYNIKCNQSLFVLEGHQKQITGLTFSIFVGLLVSSGADAQLWLWDIIAWGEGVCVPLELPGADPLTGVTRVEFLQGGALLLVTHETQIAILDPAEKEWLCRWTPQDKLPAPISSASSSASGKHIYAAFTDGNIGVFKTDSLRLISCISLFAYYISPTSRNVYPLVIAAHPDVENQVAVGLSDGSVKVIEPSESHRN